MSFRDPNGAKRGNGHELYISGANLTKSLGFGANFNEPNWHDGRFELARSSSSTKNDTLSSTKFHERTLAMSTSHEPPHDNPNLNDNTILYDASPAMFRARPVAFVLSCILVLVGVGIVILLVWYIRSRSTRLTVTSDQITLRTGWLSKNTNDVFIENVRNIQVKQSFFQRILGVGYVGISSAGQSGIEIEVDGLPDPDDLKELIDSQRSKLRQGQDD